MDYWRGGGGQRICCPPPNNWGGGLAPPIPTPMSIDLGWHSYWKEFALPGRANSFLSECHQQTVVDEM